MVPRGLWVGDDLLFSTVKTGSARLETLKANFDRSAAVGGCCRTWVNVCLHCREFVVGIVSHPCGVDALSSESGSFHGHRLACGPRDMEIRARRWAGQEALGRLRPPELHCRTNGSRPLDPRPAERIEQDGLRNLGVNSRAALVLTAAPSCCSLLPAGGERPDR